MERQVPHMPSFLPFSLQTLTWLILIVLFGVLEGVTVSLVSIWFAVGAAAALIASAFSTSVTLQLTVFVVVSAVVLACTRPLVKKQREKKAPPMNAQSNVGRTASVIAAVTPDVPGRVRLGGVDWRAQSSSALAVGTLCEVVAVQGTTLVVKPLSAG